jgi:hypothetical protein
MRCCRKIRVSLSLSLILLFAGLSFNAYACLLPLFETTAVTMGNGCSVPDEQPVRQFCDAFKTLSVESGVEVFPNAEIQTISSEDTASLLRFLVLASATRFSSDHPPESPPQDILLRISVLRI